MSCTIQDCFILQEDLTSLGPWKADWQMKFNVAKCHSMRVTRHQHHKQILIDYSDHNQSLENVQSAKYLGITISDNMDWGQHISTHFRNFFESNKDIRFLRRILAFANKPLVRPKLEYAAPIWSPYSKLQIKQVEKVQRTAARWTCRRWRNTSSVGEMLEQKHLSWSSITMYTSLNIVYRGSYMSAHVLLILLNELGERDKMRGLPSILSLFRNEFNKFNNTRARMLDSIYHMTNTLKSHFWRKNGILLSL